jgi:hypothetical protein
LGDHPAALENLRLAAQEGDGCVFEARSLWRDLIDAAVEAGDWQEACLGYNRLLQEFPDDSNLWHGCARACLMHGDLESCRHALGALQHTGIAQDGHSPLQPKEAWLLEQLGKEAGCFQHLQIDDERLKCLVADLKGLHKDPHRVVSESSLSMQLLDESFVSEYVTLSAQRAKRRRQEANPCEGDRIEHGHSEIILERLSWMELLGACRKSLEMAGRLLTALFSHTGLMQLISDKVWMWIVSRKLQTVC